MASPFDEILNTLGSTVGSIDAKVTSGKEKVSEYKSAIIARLREIVGQLDQLKRNNVLASIPALKGQLQNANAELKAKTEELEATKAQLSGANNTIADLQRQIENINSQIKTKDEEIQRAKAELQNEISKSAEKDSAIQQLNKQIEELNSQKSELQRNLEASQSQINGLIEKLKLINDSLANKIQLIDEITKDLNLDDGEVSEGFKAIADNIKAIMIMLESTDSSASLPPPTSTPSVKSQYDAIPKEQKDKLPPDIRNQIKKMLENRPSGYENTIKNMLSSQGITLKGGRRRNRNKRKTYKNRRLKLRGGYVYTSSRELDKSSSEITSRSETKGSSNNTSSVSSSNSQSRKKKNYKKRRLTKTSKARK